MAVARRVLSLASSSKFCADCNLAISSPQSCFAVRDVWKILRPGQDVLVTEVREQRPCGRTVHYTQ
ncbi:hypothetical protein B0H19DRAFT_1185490 [Mycena capillaripes]|nr:hypothetical protein B0H19DRAFT_1185490 [Mycena capillaripes]